MVIELINNLIAAFNDQEILYCHWKSNFFLSESLSGEIDLDLLVDRQSFSPALDILSGLGFKTAVIRPGSIIPGIHHYYGNDPLSGKLVHVHLFNRVLTGESFVKSHLLPFERMLLDNTYEINSIKVTSKPAELALFILRTYIKYGSLLDLLYLARKSTQIRAELQWLLADGDGSESLALIKKYCPVIDESLFTQCLAVLNSETALPGRVLLGWRVRRQLGIYAKDNLFTHFAAYGQLALVQAMRRLGGRQKNKTLSTGGAVIAFVGPEATGKSTLVSETKSWLGQAFAVRMIHAGKPPSTWITAPVNLVLPLVRQRWPSLRTSRLEGHVSQVEQNQAPSKIEGLSGLVYAVRSVTLAWDRRQLLVKARRLAANDEIVICDRYPSDTVGAMDSPRLQENPAVRGFFNQLLNRLARLECQLYRQIPPPDVVLKLKVSVETALKRNQDRIKPGKETDAYLESRHRQSREWNMPGTKYIYEIDTEQPLAETILNVKRVIWESI